MSTSVHTTKSDKAFDDEMHDVRNELQISLLKWKLGIVKKPKFEF